MGVSMTPQVRSTVRRSLGIASVWVLCAYAVVVGAEPSKSSEPKATGPSVERNADSRPNNARPTSPLMSWRGQSTNGFVRVELWRSETGQLPHELVIQTSWGEKPVKKGFLVALSRAEVEMLGFTQLFMLPSGEAHLGSPFGPVLAAILSDGTLRLYPVARVAIIEALDLKATQ
jgi:hypothetical protein